MASFSLAIDQCAGMQVPNHKPLHKKKVDVISHIRIQPGLYFAVCDQMRVCALETSKGGKK